MTDEKINAAIAEACGRKGNLICRDLNGDLWQSDLPNYCTDLNAMHEAEGVLSDDQLWDMAYTLETQSPLNFRSTARQRAEAFLRVLGKWEESE